MDTEQRFWNQVDIREPHECWPWKGRVNSRHRYGKFRIKRIEYAAHRKAYEYANGADPGEAFVCHRCDNPPCCNPNHLWLGTHVENMFDCRMKGRLNSNIPTHCPKGHPRTPQNLLVTLHRGRQRRRCRQCYNAREAAKYRAWWAEGKQLRKQLTVLIAYRGLLHAA